MGVTVPAQYQPYVNQAAQSLGISPSIVAAQIQTESSFNPNAVSPTGAQGIAQFEPGTWASYGSGSPFNPADAFAAYTKYMSVLLQQENGNISNALAAYNAGPGNLAAGQGYASSILSLAGQPGGGTASGGTGAVDAGATTAGWLQNLMGWLTGIGPLEAAGGSGGLAGALGSGIEQGIFTAFWDVFKKIFDTLLKPLFWAAEMALGPVLMLVGIGILMQQTKIGQTATNLVSLVPGPIGAVGKGAATLGGLHSVRPARYPIGERRADQREKERREARRLEPRRGRTTVTKSTGESVIL